MKRSTVVILLMLAVTGFTATGAVDTLPAPAQNIEIQPTGGPNAEFATLTDENELSVNVQRLNRDSRTRIAAVFSVTYTGNDNVEVYIEDESETVTFTALANTIEDPGNAVALDSGESIAVGLRIDTFGPVPELSDFEVNARIQDANENIPVTVDQSASGSVEISAPNIPPDTPVTVDVQAANTQSEFDAESVSVTTNQTATVDLNVSTQDDAGSTAPPVDVPNRDGEDERAIGYLNVSHGTPDGAIGGASFQITVKKSVLDSRGLSPGQVTLYRFAGGEWTPLPTSVVAESPSTVTLRADSPGLSVFAIAPVPDDGIDSGGEPPATTPTDTPADTPATTLADTPADTPTTTPTDTPADTPTTTPTDTPTDTPTTTPTDTPTDTPTTTPTDTPTDTPTTTPTDTPTDTPTTTPTDTPTDTPTTTPTDTPTDEPPAEVFGFGTGPLLVVLMLIALVIGVVIYRTRYNNS